MGSDAPVDAVPESSESESCPRCGRPVSQIVQSGPQTVVIHPCGCTTVPSEVDA